MTAARIPRSWLSTRDSCGDSMAGVTRLVVTSGLAGSDMSTTFTPRLSASDVGGEQQRGVVVGALPAGGVDVALDLVPAHRALGSGPSTMAPTSSVLQV
jgi:hypothetical protein